MDPTHEEVILVDENDREVGSMEKLEAHEKGLLHRAFSIFLFNENGDMLLQKRAAHKYHTPGLWTNACCSHPRMGETMDEALRRKLAQEMGIACPVKKAFGFTYKSQLGKGLTEHEYDHVYFGYFGGEPKPNPEEVEDWKYAPIAGIKADLKVHPEQYTPWFKMLFDRITEYAQKPEGR